MSRYLIVCRLRWPAILLLTGVIALLDQANILSWGRAWPLYLILFGVLALAERAMLASEAVPIPPQAAYPYAAGYAATGYPAAGYAGYAPPPGGSYQAAPAAPAAPAAAPSTGIVPVNTGLDLHNDLASGREEEER